jgi:hypothetical protein
MALKEKAPEALITFLVEISLCLVLSKGCGLFLKSGASYTKRLR